ncbi:helix-turn-helix domain-containing protein [Gordonia sp. VNK21]|uniref:helix-turn-helix domain-containing protein n=1 Tax=Gordonia sp. VNK21 TaxID=3382483 RepID=UPI0038D3B540
MCSLAVDTVSGYSCHVTDEHLIRNQTGVARDRSADQPVDELELEGAIAANVRRLRRQAGLSVGDMAVKIGISKAMLSKIENAQTSCSLSTLARLATAFDISVTSLFHGADLERPAVFVKAGEGASTIRAGSREGHEYQSLGSLRGEHRRLETLLVTLTEDSLTQPLFQHPGTEFLYMLEGEMDYAHSHSVYRMAPGDSLQFDGEGAHGPVQLIELPIRFLSVIAFPDAAV